MAAYIQRLLLTGTSDTQTISLGKGQKATFSIGVTTGIRIALQEPDVADGRNYFLIATSGIGAQPYYFTFTAPDDMILYMRTDADTANQIYIWIHDEGSYHA